MLCFAANSLLCRLALLTSKIDPATFTSVRLVSAAATLLLLVGVSRGSKLRPSPPDWRSVVALFAYAVLFSFAYVRLGAGTGALLLFGAVQLTMFAVALRKGERFSAKSWTALGIAVAGLVVLVLPGLSAPDPAAAALMAGAGVAWGALSILGRGNPDPLGTNAVNFAACVPLTLIVSLLATSILHVTLAGVMLALASGIVASGVGYVVWYSALRRLSRSHAATVQLSVPVIAAFGGVLLLAEPVSLRLVIASVSLLGAVAVIVTQPAVNRPEPRPWQSSR